MILTKAIAKSGKKIIKEIKKIPDKLKTKSSQFGLKEHQNDKIYWLSLKVLQQTEKLLLKSKSSTTTTTTTTNNMKKDALDDINKMSTQHLELLKNQKLEEDCLCCYCCDCNLTFVCGDEYDQNLKNENLENEINILRPHIDNINFFKNKSHRNFR